MRLKDGDTGYSSLAAMRMHVTASVISEVGSLDAQTAI